MFAGEAGTGPGTGQYVVSDQHWPDEVEIGTCVLKLGNSSVTLGQGLFLGDRCVATAENVMVLIDLQTRRPVPLPEALRTALAGRFPKAS